MFLKNPEQSSMTKWTQTSNIIWVVEIIEIDKYPNQDPFGKFLLVLLEIDPTYFVLALFSKWTLFLANDFTSCSMGIDLTPNPNPQFLAQNGI